MKYCLDGWGLGGGGGGRHVFQHDFWVFLGIMRRTWKLFTLVTGWVGWWHPKCHPWSGWGAWVVGCQDAVPTQVDAVHLLGFRCLPRNDHMSLPFAYILQQHQGMDCRES
jgi:hypothetical protein